MRPRAPRLAARGGCGAAGAHRSGGRSMSVRIVTRRLLSRAAAAPAALLSSSRGFFRATCPAHGRCHMARFSKRACLHAAPGSPVERKTMLPNMTCEPAALCRPQHVAEPRGGPPLPVGAAQPQSPGRARGCRLHGGQRRGGAREARASLAPLSTASRSSNCCSSVSAVLVPTPATPGTLSAASPLSASTSAHCAPGRTRGRALAGLQRARGPPARGGLTPACHGCAHTTLG
jgi:hypothetical protein